MDDAANGRRDPTNSEDLDRADINPAADFKLSGDDEALAVAEKLGR